MTTGVLLLSARPHEYAAKSVVWLKLAFKFVTIGNAMVFERRARAEPQPARVMLHAAASILLWASALFLGRWIAFA